MMVVPMLCAVVVVLHAVLHLSPHLSDPALSYSGAWQVAQAPHLCVSSVPMSCVVPQAVAQVQVVVQVSAHALCKTAQ